MTWNAIGQTQRIVARDFKIPLRKMCEPDAAREVAWPRQAAYYVAKTVTDKPLTVIARRFKRDRKTISFGIRQTAARMDADPSFRERVEKLVERAVAIAQPRGLD